MIYLKTVEEIRIMKEGGRRLASILRRLASEVKPGLQTAYLEDLANQWITEAGGFPAFKDYPMGGKIFFPSSLCVSINDEVVHGAALPDRILKSGDIVDLDIGMEWPITPELKKEYAAPTNQYSPHGGFYSDTCLTVPVAKVSAGAKKLIQVTRECLEKGIKAAQPGAFMNDIARAVESHAHQHGYGVVEDLVGHGLGYYIHEKPDVLHFTVNDQSPDNIRLEPGMVIAIEPMINLGDWQVKTAKNGYTIVTADGSLSAHFEHSIAITQDGPLILTA